MIAAKGAPEAIADLCHLGEEQNTQLQVQVEKMAADGLRVIAVAKAVFRERELPGGQHDFSFTHLGLIGFADPHVRFGLRFNPVMPAAARILAQLTHGKWVT